MIPPPLPPDESNRLCALRALSLLDTPAEERFDRLTRLAARIFGVPISLFTLIDEQRQWFKSNHGLPMSQTPRQQSLCAHAILNAGPFVIEDARCDPRFQGNPLVTSDPKIRFYAGVPIAASDGSRLGTLCVIGKEPRKVRQADVATLQALGRLIESELRLHRSTSSDELTGLSNRQGFTRVGDYALAHARSQPHDLQLLCVEAGVESGRALQSEVSANVPAVERTIASIVRLLASSFPDALLTARIGTLAFALLLPIEAVEMTDRVARLRNHVAALNLERAKAPSIELNLAYASFQEFPRASTEELLRATESRLWPHDFAQTQFFEISELSPITTEGGQSR